MCTFIVEEISLAAPSKRLFPFFASGIHFIFSKTESNKGKLPFFSLTFFFNNFSICSIFLILADEKGKTRSFWRNRSNFEALSRWPFSSQTLMMMKKLLSRPKTLVTRGAVLEVLVPHLLYSMNGILWLIFYGELFNRKERRALCNLPKLVYFGQDHLWQARSEKVGISSVVENGAGKKIGPIRNDLDRNQPIKSCILCGLANQIECGEAN